MVAVEAGHLEVVQELLKQSCEVNHQDKVNDSDTSTCDTPVLLLLFNPKVHGRSVLHIAVEKGFTEIYKLLSNPTICQIDTTLRDKVSTTSVPPPPPPPPHPLPHPHSPPTTGSSCK